MATQTTRRVISERLVAALLTAVLIALVSFTVHALNKEKIMPQEVTLELGKNGPESFKQAGAVADLRQFTHPLPDRIVCRRFDALLMA